MQKKQSEVAVTKTEKLINKNKKNISYLKVHGHKIVKLNCLYK